MKYIFEKNHKIPLCGVSDECFYKFEDGLIIDNPDVIDFIKNGLDKKTLKIKDTSLLIYELKNKNSLIGFNYVIDGVNNYLDTYKQPLMKKEKEILINKLLSNELKEELMWGIDNE